MLANKKQLLKQLLRVFHLNELVVPQKLRSEWKRLLEQLAEFGNNILVAVLASIL